VPFLLGKAVAPLTPTVTGTVTSYSVVPPLPAGISINATTGVISGTPSALSPATIYTISASNSVGHTSYGLQLNVDSGPTVHLHAAASDTAGNSLSYTWKTTDGELLNVNGADADWLLPAGPGLHFAYALIANGHGGYTERRVAVNTDAIGNPALAPPPVTLAPPPAPARTGDPLRVFAGILGDPLNSPLSPSTGYSPRTYDPGIFIFAQDSANGRRYPATGALTSNLRGEVTFQNVLPTTSPLSLSCSRDGINFSSCGGDMGLVSAQGREPAPAGYAGTAYQSALSGGPFSLNGTLVSSFGDLLGQVALADGSTCGTVNEFFGVLVTAKVSVLDASNAVLWGPVSTNEDGNFDLPILSNGVTVSIRCEGSAAVSLPVSMATNPQLGRITIPASGAPVVAALTATFNGSVVAQLTPAGPARPSDKVPQADKFLAFLGLDSRLSACRYYQAIGAIATCDAAGNFSGAISFDDWKRSVKIDSNAPPGAPPTYTATYINKVDLNLLRNHHSISYGPGQTAAYVCNHLGPSVLDPTQAEIDAVVDTAAGSNNQKLVACVAMDYLTWPGVNGGQPFTRFLIFGPGGQLLPSVNLDGRREKFVPGTCVICHGGDHYAGRFPEDGTGSPDLGAHFLPYDTGNFEFSSKAGLTEADQSANIYNLNQNALNAGPTSAIKTLVTAWYAAGGTTLNKTYISPAWPSGWASMYLNVYARSCRTCHVALPEPYNFDDFANWNGVNSYPYNTAGAQVATAVCGKQLSLLDYSMPASLVTFDRFWESAGTAVDQPAIAATVGVTTLVPRRSTSSCVQK
jgi:hypothetical protein